MKLTKEEIRDNIDLQVDTAFTTLGGQIIAINRSDENCQQLKKTIVNRIDDFVQGLLDD